MVILFGAIVIADVVIAAVCRRGVEEGGSIVGFSRVVIYELKEYVRTEIGKHGCYDELHDHRRCDKWLE